MFTTTDLAAAAFLLSQGCRLVQVIPGAFCGFSFDDAEGLPSVLIAVWNSSDPTGSIKDYVVAEQKLRREIRRAS